MSDSCNPMGCSPPGSSLHGISQARTLEWVAIAFSGDLPDPGIEPVSPPLKLKKSQDVHFIHFFERSSQYKKKLNVCKLEKMHIHTYICIYVILFIDNMIIHVKKKPMETK